METRLLILRFSKIQFISSNFSSSLTVDLVTQITMFVKFVEGREKTNTKPEKVSWKFAQLKVTDLTDKLITWQNTMFTYPEKAMVVKLQNCTYR